jgi:hypothetical protein
LTSKPFAQAGCFLRQLLLALFKGCLSHCCSLAADLAADLAAGLAAGLAADLAAGLAADLAAADSTQLRDAFREEPAAAASMLEAAVRAAFSKPAATFTAAASTAADGCQVLLDAAMKLCALVLLENPADDDDTRPALLMDLEEAENLNMLHAAQHAVQFAGTDAHRVAAVAAAAAAAAEAGAAVAQQQRLQLLLRVVSLLGSCIKVMAHQQQQQHAFSWGQVALRCRRIAILSTALAGYEEALMEQRMDSIREATEDTIGDLDASCEGEGISLLSGACMDFVSAMLVQHPYARQLARDNIGVLHALLKQCVQDPSLAAEQVTADIWVLDRDAAARAAAAAAAEPSASPEQVLLAALLCDTISEGSFSVDAAPISDVAGPAGIEVSSVIGISDQTHAALADACGGHACSSSSSVLTMQDLKLECMAVAIRSMRLYGKVLEAALSHPCLNKSSSAEERTAGAAQLAQQLDRLQASGERVLLPDDIQLQMRLYGRQQCLDSAQGSAAAIGALLGDVPAGLRCMQVCVGWIRRQLWDLEQPQQQPILGVPNAKDADKAACAPIQVFLNTRALQRSAQLLVVMAVKAERRLLQLQEMRLQMRPQGPPNSAGESQQLTADETARSTLMWVQEATLLSEVHSRRREGVQRLASDLADTRYSELDFDDTGPVGLGPQWRSWADAVAAALPSRRCCANPCCVSLREMSEWQMVWGRGCVCGGCAAGSGQAVRYCSRECQTAHWPAHKPVCLRLRQQQQLQSPAAEQQT